MTEPLNIRPKVFYTPPFCPALGAVPSKEQIEPMSNEEKLAEIAQLRDELEDSTHPRNLDGLIRGLYGILDAPSSEPPGEVVTVLHDPVSREYVIALWDWEEGFPKRGIDRAAHNITVPNGSNYVKARMTLTPLEDDDER